MPDVYRACASLVVFRPSADGTSFEILLLHKPRKRDSWQLPQGGVEEGETVEMAALRELKEEAGMQARMIGGSATVYQYEYPQSYRRFRPDNVRGQRIEFIFATADRHAPLQVDNKEIDAFVWIAPADLTRYIHRKQYVETILRLVEEGRKLLG